jgi:hypothetical protein
LLFAKIDFKQLVEEFEYATPLIKDIKKEIVPMVDEM